MTVPDRDVNCVATEVDKKTSAVLAHPEVIHSSVKPGLTRLGFYP